MKMSIELYDTSNDADDININNEIIEKIEKEKNLCPNLPEVSYVVCMFVCVHAHTHTHTYTHIYTHTHAYNNSNNNNNNQFIFSWSNITIVFASMKIKNHEIKKLIVTKYNQQ